MNTSPHLYSIGNSIRCFWLFQINTILSQSLNTKQSFEKSVCFLRKWIPFIFTNISHSFTIFFLFACYLSWSFTICPCSSSISLLSFSAFILADLALHIFPLNKSFVSREVLKILPWGNTRTTASHFRLLHSQNILLIYTKKNLPFINFVYDVRILEVFAWEYKFYLIDKWFVYNLIRTCWSSLGKIIILLGFTCSRTIHY